MASLYTHKDENVTKTWLLMSLFFGVVIALGWGISYAYRAPEILVFAVIFSIFMNVWGYWFSDKLVLKLTGARPASREVFFDLYTVTENLSITAGLPMPALYVIDEPVPNAFATGRNAEHATVVVTSGLLKMLNRIELEGVIAHELSHVGNRDILLSTAVVVLVGFVTLLSDFFLRTRFFRSNDRDNNAGGFALIVGIMLAVLSPIAATLIQFAISRKREFLADTSGALLTRYPEGLASALEKISMHGGVMRRANNATAHLFIANPFGPEHQKANWLSRLFMTHPPVEERIQALRDSAL